VAKVLVCWRLGGWAEGEGAALEGPKRLDGAHKERCTVILTIRRVACHWCVLDAGRTSTPHKNPWATAATCAQACADKQGTVDGLDQLIPSMASG